MLVLGLAGSPRCGGNSEILLDEALDSAAKAGAATEKIMLSELSFSPCTSCGCCETSGVCKFSDDISKVYDRIEASHALILASPVYFYNVTAWAKAVIDRAQATWSRRYIIKEVNTFPRRKGAFIGVGATTGSKLFEGSCLTVKYFFDAVHCDYHSDLLVKGVDGKGEIKDYPQHIEAARTLGAALTQSDKLRLP
jgi:multimeric flavodoxin WrbA